MYLPRKRTLESTRVQITIVDLHPDLNRSLATHCNCFEKLLVLPSTGAIKTIKLQTFKAYYQVIHILWGQSSLEEFYAYICEVLTNHLQVKQKHGWTAGSLEMECNLDLHRRVGVKKSVPTQEETSKTSPGVLLITRYIENLGGQASDTTMGSLAMRPTRDSVL